MKGDAELHAEEDKQRRETIELHNVAESAAYRAEKLITEQEDKLDEETKSTLQAKIQSLRDALAAEPVDDEVVRAAMEDLNGALMQAGEQIYGSQEQAAAAADASDGGGDNDGDSDSGQGGAGEPAEEGTVEGEFREV